MARSDLLKKLFRSFKGRNDSAFMEAARELAEDERKKHHQALADELLRILENGTPTPSNGVRSFDALPKDSDRGSLLLDIAQPDCYLQDVILTDAQEKILKRVVTEFRSWEVLEANGLRPSHKLLFCGPPGCGKTLTAEALSGELGLPLVTVRFDAVVSSLLGETAANLRKVFDYVSKGTWVVLFDEFDAIGRSRDDPTEHGELKRVVNTFLQMLDRFTGRSLVIAATNYEQSLDPALWRRFDEVIRFSRPSTGEIARLMEARFRHLRFPATVVSEAATRLTGASHADVDRVCLDVLKAVALTGRKSVTPEDIETAVVRQTDRRQILLESKPHGPSAVDEA